MPENNGVLESVTVAMSDAVGKLASRKFGIAIAGMYFLQQMQAPTWQIFGLGAGALASQFALDAIERLWLKTDLPDNGNGGDSGMVKT